MKASRGADSMASEKPYSSLQRPFKAAHATADNWAHAAKACVAHLGTIDPEDNLGFIYATEDLNEHLSSILAFLRQTTKIQHWVGAVGMGVCGVGSETHAGMGLSVMVAALPEGSFHILHSLYEANQNLDPSLQKWLAGRAAFLGVVHGDPRNSELPAIIGHLAADTGCFLVGGLTAVLDQEQQVADTLTGGGLSGVLLNRNVAAVVGLSQGCAPVGPVHVITECMSNVVVSLDGRPALEVLKEDVGDLLSQDHHRIAGTIHVGLPVDGSDRGDYVVRTLVGVDASHGWLSVAAELDAGDRLLFVRRDPVIAQSDLRRVLKDVKRRLEGKARGALYFSCVGRGPNLFGAPNAEMALIREELGDIPITGFYANGEINHDRLYGYTGVLTLFS